MFDRQFRIDELVSLHVYFFPGLMISIIIIWSNSKYSQLPALILMHFYYREKKCTRLSYSRESKKHHYPGETEEETLSRLKHCVFLLRVHCTVLCAGDRYEITPGGGKQTGAHHRAPTLSRASENKSRGLKPWL